MDEEQQQFVHGQLPVHTQYERDKLEYELTVRQEPKQARMCGVGADRRPIDPPPIVQLRVIDPSQRREQSSDSRASSPDTTSSTSLASQSFLQNPYYFMFASLAKPDEDVELHWLKDGKTRCTTGSVVSSLYHLKDSEAGGADAGFFVFPDVSVRTEGSYRLKLSLYEVVGSHVYHCKSIFSAPFYVYTAKKFPGMEESTPLSCSLADQGIKIRIRKDIRVRKRTTQGAPMPIPIPMGGGPVGPLGPVPVPLPMDGDEPPPPAMPPLGLGGRVPPPPPPPPPAPAGPIMGAYGPVPVRLPDSPEPDEEEEEQERQKELEREAERERQRQREDDERRERERREREEVEREREAERERERERQREEQRREKEREREREREDARRAARRNSGGSSGRRNSAGEPLSKRARGQDPVDDGEPQASPTNWGPIDPALSGQSDHVAPPPPAGAADHQYAQPAYDHRYASGPPPAHGGYQYDHHAPVPPPAHHYAPPHPSQSHGQVYAVTASSPTATTYQHAYPPPPPPSAWHGYEAYGNAPAYVVPQQQQPHGHHPVRYDYQQNYPPVPQGYPYYEQGQGHAPPAHPAPATSPHEPQHYSHHSYPEPPSPPSASGSSHAPPPASYHYSSAPAPAPSTSSATSSSAIYASAPISPEDPPAHTRHASTRYHAQPYPPQSTAHYAAPAPAPAYGSQYAQSAGHSPTARHSGYLASAGTSPTSATAPEGPWSGGGYGAHQTQWSANPGMMVQDTYASYSGRDGSGVRLAPMRHASPPPGGASGERGKKNPLSIGSIISEDSN